MNTEEAIEAVRAEREHQKERWSPSHDRRHELFEWVGLISMYASRGRLKEAAALAIAAMEAEGK